MVLRRRPWYRLKRNTIPAAFLVLGAIVATAAVLSPWPAALVIRAVFERGAQTTIADMAPFVPATGVDSQLDVSYAGDSPNTTMDVFSASSPATVALPTVIWIHGGAWISGSKTNVDPYLQIIAAKGYTTIALNYTVAPEATYPTAVVQLNEALAFIVANAAKYRVDPTRIVLAGDSAGAQLASQLANLTTNPAYASQLALQPALAPAQLRGIILNCGIYDLSGIPEAPGIFGWGFRVALWAYLGSKSWSDTPGDTQMSSIDSVTAAFPPTWISGGNGDPLTAGQSEPLAAKLTSLGVAVTPVFYPADHEPQLPHEYQFHLQLTDAQSALESTLQYLSTVTAPQ